MKKTYKLVDLDCANCAAKMERAIAELPEVKAVSVSFLKQKMSVELDDWLKRAAESEIQICVVSNSKRGRVVEFCDKYGIDCITHAKKPFSRGIRACLRRYETEPRRAALVGDQIYTDVLGANCAGVRSILIPAIHNHNIWLKLRHVAELPFIWLAGGRREGE